MAMSKVKSSKQAKRLAARVAAWEKMSTTDKTSGKSGRSIYAKPGSQRK